MAIAYPLAMPAGMLFTDTEWMANPVVGVSRSDFTFAVQTYVWPGECWGFRGRVRPTKNDATADAIVAFLLALNGQQGTFSMGDATRPTTRGSAAGAWTVAAGAVAMSTTLPATGAGSFAVGDWLQVGTYLHRVTQVNSAASYDVWPRLRGGLRQRHGHHLQFAQGAFPFGVQ